MAGARDVTLGVVQRHAVLALVAVLLAAPARGARLTVRRGTRADILSRSRAPWNLARPSDILVCEEDGRLLGFLQSASIGAGFLFLADELQLAELVAEDAAARRELAKQALSRLPVGKRLWWLGSAADNDSLAALQAAGFEKASIAETARALWPALAFFGTPIFVLPLFIFAFPLLPQLLDFIDSLSLTERAGLAAVPPVLTLAASAAALSGKTAMRGDGSRSKRK